MNKEIFEEYSIPKAIRILALPTIMGMLVNVIYNMADTFFVGQTQDTNQVAAVTITMPIFLLLLSIGNVFAIGGGSYISRLLGEKNYAKIKNTSSFCFYCTIAIGIIFSIISLIFINPILNVIGSNESTYHFAKGYIQILVIGAPFICIQTAFAGIVRAEGASKISMIGMMIGTILNIVLDPIMILYMDMGVIGAALATVMGNIASCIYYIIYCVRKNTCLSISIKHFSFEKSIIKNIFFIGVPASLNTVLVSISTVLLNNYAEFYGNIAISAIGIANRINTISIMLLFGLAQGSQPFIAYNYAAKNYERMKKALFFSIKVGICIGATILIVILLFSEQIVRMFIQNADVIENGKYFVKATMSVAPILAIFFMSMTTFQAIGKALPALFISILRQGIAFIPAIIIGNKIWGLNGIIWAQPFADFVAIITSLVFLVIIRKNLNLNNQQNFSNQ